MVISLMNLLLQI